MGQELRKISDKIDSAIDGLDPTQKEDIPLLVQAARERRQQLEFYEKFVDNLVEADLDRPQTTSSLTVLRELEHLEDQGIIEIKQSEAK